MSVRDETLGGEKAQRIGRSMRKPGLKAKSSDDKQYKFRLTELLLVLLRGPVSRSVFSVKSGATDVRSGRNFEGRESSTKRTFYEKARPSDEKFRRQTIKVLSDRTNQKVKKYFLPLVIPIPPFWGQYVNAAQEAKPCTPPAPRGGTAL